MTLAVSNLSRNSKQMRQQTKKSLKSKSAGINMWLVMDKSD